MKKNPILKMVIISLFSAISIIVTSIINIPIIPIAPFLKYDIADIPIILAMLILGYSSGLSVLFISSLFQSFFLAGDGLLGFIMHFISSGTLVLVSGLIINNSKNIKKIIIGLVFGSLAMTLIMIPMNYIFTVHFYGIPKEFLDTILLPAIIPFNLIKSFVNSIISIIIFKLLSPFLRKNNIF